MGGPVDGRADIYALGVMLFEALTGRTPFVGENYHAIAHSHIYEPPPDPCMFNPSIPLPVRDVIITTLQKRPEMRYQNASELANALDMAVTASNKHASIPRTSSFIDRVPTRPITPSDFEASNSSAGNHKGQPYTVQAMYPCPNCHSANKPEVSYCIRCGSYMNLCSNCYRANRAKDRFCTRCGQQLQ